MTEYRNEHGDLHSVGGPAFIEDDYREWWIDGVQMTESEFNGRTV